jgi:hypothetical protein
MSCEFFFCCCAFSAPALTTWNFITVYFLFFYFAKTSNRHYISSRMRRCTLFSFPCHLKMEVDHAGLYFCTNRHRHTSWDTLISFHHYHHVISVRSNYSELTHNHQQFTVEALFNSVGTNKWNEMKNVDRNMRKTNVFHYIKKLFRSTLSSRNNVQWVTCVRTKYKHTVQASQQVVICFEIENQQFCIFICTERNFFAQHL